jgi:hypothetical protein
MEDRNTINVGQKFQQLMEDRDSIDAEKLAQRTHIMEDNITTTKVNTMHSIDEE